MNEDITQIDSPHLTDEDLNKLGLRENPFAEHADETFLYSDSQLEMTSNIIMEYLTNPATTIVLTGENGIGKTTFLRKVLRLGYQQYQFCTLRVNEDTDFDYIENKIKQRWVLAETNEHSSVADLSIENYVITYLREYTHAVLIIDDAHFLDSATLDRLFTLKHRIGLACPLSLGFILAGESSLKPTISTLEDSNPACTQVYQINVRPFTHDQTKQYIEHRLQVAGLEDEILFDDVKITEIYKATLGNVKKIHENATYALQHQSDEDTLDEGLNPHITIRNPKPKVPVFLITLLAIIGIGAYINHRISSNSPDETTVPLEVPLTSEPTLSPIAQEAHSPASQQTPSLPLPNTPTPTKTLDISNLQNLEVPDQPTTKDLPSLLSESIEELDEKQLNKPKEAVVAKADTVNKPQPATENIKQKTAVPIADKNPQANSSTHGEKWLKNLDSSSYTLQVVATKDSKQLESLVKKENLKTNYAYFDKPVKDATYYVLVVGNYKNRDEAIDAASKLPESLRKNKPWPIPLKNIQKFLD